MLEPLELARAGARDERLARARDAMERVGLPQEIYERYPHQLSGGQKQRVLIARALTLRPKLIVCDEVVAALDMSIRGDVLNLFAELQRDLGLTYVFITHDLSVVSHISDRIAVMYLGRFVELGPTEQVSGTPMHPYTQALLSAEPLPLPSIHAQRQAHHPRGRDPEPDRSAVRLPLPHPLPLRASASAPRRRPNGASLRRITGSRAISPTGRIFRRTEATATSREDNNMTIDRLQAAAITRRNAIALMSGVAITASARRAGAGAGNPEARRHAARLRLHQSLEP